MSWTPREPTPEQCSASARVDASSPETRAFACWYPQMGGYVGKCVIEFFPGSDATCFDAWVWHDGEFPFESGNPRRIHHCDAGQFVRFGELVMKLQAGS